ncbi:MAG: CBS domain-containing protein [Betaproteobacteria bacterium]|nr:CBS domain-containing protein [Betaproteobacteria bacterium]
MQDEQQEIVDFLRRYPPFRDLDEGALEHIGGSIDVRYYKAGSPIVDFGQDALFWHIVRSGVVEVFRRDGTLYNRLTEGDYFGEFGLLHRKKVRFPARASEDTLLYLVPEPVFTELFERNETFADQVEIEDRSRLQKVVSRQQAGNDLLSATVESLVQREPVTLPDSASSLEAARCMTEAGVSSLLLVSGSGDTDAAVTLAGIVTDRDLRTRLVAKGLPLETPAVTIATTQVVTIEHSRLVFEAMLVMLHNNVHHLPVLHQQRPIGVIALSDIIRHESHNSLFVVSRIYRAQTVDELAALAPEARASFVRMAGGDTSARIVGSAMSAIGRAFKQRLLELAEQQFGAPPLPYCFLALGSMGRQEQSVVTDQDNALVLDNRFDPGRHDEYFEQLAKFVSDGLARCGYTYCTGGVMATNRKWRQPLKVWEGYFDTWIEHPTPEGLLDSNIFFDLDGVYGRTEWAEGLRRRFARNARQHPRFLASMARNALLRTPPLGFFKDFVLEADGRHSAAINLKRRGTAPLTDLIRVHALAVGSEALNSYERLVEVMRAKVLPPGRGADLLDALEFIAWVRLRNQVEDLKAGREPDNSIEPERLSEFERKSLREAFTVLSHAQDFLKYRYQSARAIG